MLGFYRVILWTGIVISVEFYGRKSQYNTRIELKSTYKKVNQKGFKLFKKSKPKKSYHIKELI